MSYSIESHNGFEVPSGFKTALAVERIFKYSLPKPYSNCDDIIEKNELKNSEIYDAIIRYGYDYEQQFCMSKRFLFGKN